jgi:hypothetical protein
MKINAVGIRENARIAFNDDSIVQASAFSLINIENAYPT